MLFMKVTIAKSNLWNVAGIQPTHDKEFLLSKLCDPRHSGKQFHTGITSHDNEKLWGGKTAWNGFIPQRNWKQQFNLTMKVLKVKVKY